MVRQAHHERSPGRFDSVRPEPVEGRAPLSTGLSKGTVTDAQIITSSCIDIKYLTRQARHF